MRTAIEHAGAERGLLILLWGERPEIAADASTGQGGIQVTVRQSAVKPSDLLQSALNYVIRTRTRLVLDDALANDLYSEDEYVRQRRVRSVLCLPILKQAKLVGAFYLENNLTPRAFTSDHVSVLELLASQAAISLENALLYSDLQRSEAFLAQAQNISHTGSFGWSVPTGEIFCSEETYRIFEFDRATKPTVELALRRIHPDDRAFVQETIDRVSKASSNFDLEYRLLMPDGAVKHLYVVVHARKNSPGEFVGSVTDISERKRAEVDLQRAFDEITKLKDQLYEENIALKEEIGQASMFEEIVGCSDPLRKVLVQVSKVAPADSTVLITGETGTGKELIARAIHNRSSRSNGAFVQVNCAAIPQSLIAS
jgi:transcriptional regulator with GAF, ATPase, and Fis domain